MALAKEELKNTMKTERFEDAPYTTRFSFNLPDNQSRQMVSSSLEGIEVVLPYVLALNPEINSVSIEAHTTRRVWQQTEVKHTQSGASLTKITTGERTNDSWIAVKYEGD